MRARLGGRLALAALITLPVAGCDTLGASIFRPASDLNPDTIPPAFSDPRPAPDVAVVSAEAFTVQITDPAVGGVAGSGVDPMRIEANVIGGGALPVTALLPLVTIHVSGRPDGALQVAIVARDHAGNSGVYVFTTSLDRTAPSVSFSSFPSTAVTTAQTALRVDMIVRVGEEPNFEAGSVEIRDPGPDGTCGTADDAPVPPGVVGGLSSQTLPGPGSHALAFFLTNPVPPLGQSQAALYCWIATARDAARSADGNPGVNTSQAVASTLVTWRAPAP